MTTKETAKLETIEQVEETTETTETTKKGRTKKQNSNIRKTVTFSEEKYSEVKAIADNFQITDLELIYMAIDAVIANGDLIHQAQEKNAQKIDVIIKDGIKRHCNQIVKQENIGSLNSALNEAYEYIKSLPKQPRSIASALANTVVNNNGKKGTNYETARKWLEVHHPEELNKTK